MRPPPPETAVEVDAVASVARALLDLAARVDFDPDFRRAVETDAAAALATAGLPPAELALLLDDEHVQVTLFGAVGRAIAARAHDRAMGLLRGGGHLLRNPMAGDAGVSVAEPQSAHAREGGCR